LFKPRESIVTTSEKMKLFGKSLRVYLSKLHATIRELNADKRPQAQLPLALENLSLVWHNRLMVLGRTLLHATGNRVYLDMVPSLL
ncbi:MAG: hypothetical protein LDL07_12335, partial [Desulfarculus sp.]|nr:hypothetical protein [Desulfarculus sp.]